MPLRFSIIFKHALAVNCLLESFFFSKIEQKRNQELLLFFFLFCHPERTQRENQSFPNCIHKIEQLHSICRGVIHCEIICKTNQKQSRYFSNSRD